MLKITSIALLFSYLLLVWLKTNAFVEYMQLFRLSRFLKVSEYLQIQENGYGGVFADFLQEYYHDYFIVRLLSCPICVSFWLGILTSLYTGEIISILAAPLVLFFYLLFNKLL